MAKLTSLTKTQIQNFLNHYSDYAGKTFRAKALAAGTVNTIYKIDLSKPKKTVYLKIDEVGNRARFKQEFQLLQILAAQKQKLGFAVACPLWQTNKKSQSQLNQKWASLLPEVPGRSLPVQKLASVNFLQLGRALRQLHALPIARQTFLHHWNLKTLQSLYKSLQPQIQKKDQNLARLLQQTLQNLQKQKIKASARWIHGDLFFDNIHWQKNKLVGLLDFEYSGLGDPLYDVAMTLLANAWRHKTLDLAHCQAFLKGYQPQQQSAAAWRFGFAHAALTIVLTRLKTFEFGPLSGNSKNYRDYRDFLQRLEWCQSNDFSGFLSIV